MGASHERDARAIERVVAHARPDLPDGRYLHWDELRRRTPPTPLSHEEWWDAQKLARRAAATSIPGLITRTGRPFWFCRVDALARATHALDRSDVARELIRAVDDVRVRDAYRNEQLIEEAISSSVLEGARITTRAQAKAMVQERRDPTTFGERMILNNYLGMERILALRERALTRDDLLELHALLGRDALEVSGAAGRWRRAGEDVAVVDPITNEVWHTPPPASELESGIESMLRFANATDDGGPFVHPLLRAMILHFWLAYLHPFADGNGRMARALFYFGMLRAGYEFAPYLSISGPIDRSKRQYYLAFAHTETDEGDLTYFLLNQARMLRVATDDLLGHLRDRGEARRRMHATIEETILLNERQRTRIQSMLEEPHAPVEVHAHAARFGVSYLTARKDLQDLEARGYLVRHRVGRTDRYVLAPTFAAKLARDSEA